MTRSSIVTRSAGVPARSGKGTGCARIPRIIRHHLRSSLFSGRMAQDNGRIAALPHGARYMPSLRDSERWHFVHFTDPGFQRKQCWNDTIFDRDPERGRPRPLWKRTGCARIPRIIRHHLRSPLFSGRMAQDNSRIAALTHCARYMPSLRESLVRSRHSRG